MRRNRRSLTSWSRSFRRRPTSRIMWIVPHRIVALILAKSQMMHVTLIMILLGIVRFNLDAHYFEEWVILFADLGSVASLTL